MQTSLFDFQLPPDRIAHQPVNPRDAARLLHVSGDALHDLTVRDLPSLLMPGDVLVFNDSRVIPARLFCEVGGKQVEVLLHRSYTPSFPSGGEVWQAFARPAKKLKPGMELHFAPNFSATVEGRTEDGQVLLRFMDQGPSLFDKLRTHGHMPLPPYIDRADTAEDAERYQTVYAAHDGSVAAPTAGLHFTPELLAALKQKGIHIAFVTLHVGAGTFQPVKVDDTDDHVMHREWIEVSQHTADTLNAARAAGGRVVAVGTTSLRVLESAAAIQTMHRSSSPLPSPCSGASAVASLSLIEGEGGGALATKGEGVYMLQPFFGETGIFITPGYRFKIVDTLMTNFHLPKSSLFMLVSAFAGLERMHAAYAHAIANNYRFYSYGDTSVLERA